MAKLPFPTVADWLMQHKRDPFVQCILYWIEQEHKQVDTVKSIIYDTYDPNPWVTVVFFDGTQITKPFHALEMPPAES